MNHSRFQRKQVDKLSTHDFSAYLRFIAANACSVSTMPEDADGTRILLDPRFHGDASAYNANNFTILRSRTRRDFVPRQRSLADIKNDPHRRHMVILSASGLAAVSQLGREVMCAPDSMTLISGWDPFIFKKQGDFDALVILLPTEFVEKRLRKVDDLCCRRVPHSHGVQHLVSASLTALQKEADNMSSYELQSSISAVSDLIVLALGQTVDVQSQSSSVRTANLQRVKRLIRERCQGSEVSLGGIASECGISVRYLHNLFRDDGRTAAEYLMQERLRHAWRMLELGSPRTISVTDVCFASGFSNVSHFSTRFKRAFSVSPADVLRNRTDMIVSTGGPAFAAAGIQTEALATPVLASE